MHSYLFFLGWCCIIALCGVTGAILFKFGMMQVGNVQWTFGWWLNAVFTPIIMVAIIILFVGRMLWFMPLQMKTLGTFAVVETILMVALMIVASYTIFKEPVSVRQIVGIGIAFVALILMES